jgi:hypothetical protein
VPNRQLTKEERLELFAPLLEQVRLDLAKLSNGDPALLWALRRKLFKELTYDERSRPMERRALKTRKALEQGGKCAACRRRFPKKYSVLDRIQAMEGYTAKNTRVLCTVCDIKIQVKRGYK